MIIENENLLREMYGFPKGRATLKQLAALEKHSIGFIQRAPFVVLATVSKGYHLDNSPRGGQPGFVKVVDDHTLIIPDSKGNNRLDSLVNIINTARVGCLFIIPGIDETLRVNGRAKLSTDPKFLAFFDDDKNQPKCVIEIAIEEVFLHCAKAFMRANLWAEEAKLDRSALPTMGKMLNDQIGESSEPESHQAMLARYRKDL